MGSVHRAEPGAIGSETEPDTPWARPGTLGSEHEAGSPWAEPGTLGAEPESATPWAGTRNALAEGLMHTLDPHAFLRLNFATEHSPDTERFDRGLASCLLKMISSGDFRSGTSASRSQCDLAHRHKAAFSVDQCAESFPMFRSQPGQKHAVLETLWMYLLRNIVP